MSVYRLYLSGDDVLRPYTNLDVRFDNTGKTKDREKKHRKTYNIIKKFLEWLKWFHK